MGFVVYRVAFGWVLLAVSLFSRANAPNAQLHLLRARTFHYLPAPFLVCPKPVLAFGTPPFFVFGAP
jgi:hypothetical protein